MNIKFGMLINTGGALLETTQAAADGNGGTIYFLPDGRKSPAELAVTKDDIKKFRKLLDQLDPPETPKKGGGLFST